MLLIIILLHEVSDLKLYTGSTVVVVNVTPPRTRYLYYQHHKEYLLCTLNASTDARITSKMHPTDTTAAYVCQRN